MDFQRLRRHLAAASFLVISTVPANASMITGSLGLNGFGPTQTAANLSIVPNVISTTNITLAGSATVD
jgi:hypothetical protein